MPKPIRKTLPRQAHSDTSTAAAELMKGGAATARKRVLHLLTVAAGATDEEMQNALEMNPSTQRPRRVELVEMGLVEDSGVRRKTKSGSKAVVWKPVHDRDALKSRVRKPQRKPVRKAARKGIEPKWQLHHGDCPMVMRDMPDECVHSVVTSPPYWALRDYNAEDQHGLEDTIEAWLEVQVAVFEEVRRILRSDGTLWLNIGDNYIAGELQGQPWLLAHAMKKAGWVLRADIIWSKPNPIPQPAGRRRPALSHEYIFLFAKQTTGYYFDDEAVREKAQSSPTKLQGTPTRRDPDGGRQHRVVGPIAQPSTRNIRTVWDIPAGGTEGHFAAFPEKLPEICIKAGTSEHGCCEVCGAPYERILEKTELGEKLLGKGWHDHEDDLGRGQRKAAPATAESLYRTVGWKAGCECGMGLAPCRVFDPYTGSGTTGRVALALGRSFTGIELNDDYFKLAQKRLTEGASKGGVVSDDDLKTRSDLGLMNTLEKDLFGV